MKLYFTYILANKRNGTLYIGITSNLIKRIYEHKNQQTEGFTKRYHIDQLVYFEEHQDIKEAILREKRLKRWKREWKLKLIESKNPHWQGLSNSLT